MSARAGAASSEGGQPKESAVGVEGVGSPCLDEFERCFFAAVDQALADSAIHPENKAQRVYYDFFSASPRKPEGGGGKDLSGCLAPSRHAVALFDLDGAVVDRGQHLAGVAGDDDIDDGRAIGFGEAGREC